jgi:hypothetical protein
VYYKTDNSKLLINNELSTVFFLFLRWKAAMWVKNLITKTLRSLRKNSVTFAVSVFQLFRHPTFHFTQFIHVFRQSKIESTPKS